MYEIFVISVERIWKILTRRVTLCGRNRSVLSRDQALSGVVVICCKQQAKN